MSTECLTAQRHQRLSHDNLFHTVLGLMNVTTDVYVEELDAFAPCRGLNARSLRSPASPSKQG